MFNEELENELCRLRQAIIDSKAVEKQLEQKISKNASDSRIWEKRLSESEHKGELELSKSCKERVTQHKEEADRLQIELFAQKDSTASMQKELNRLETRRFSSSNSGSDALRQADASLSAFDRLEDKILAHESRAEISEDELAERKLASDFKEKEKESEIEAQLKALKASLGNAEES